MTTQPLDLDVPPSQSRPTSCGWCGLHIDQPRIGRPRKFCSQSHKQRAHEARVAAERGAVAPDSVVLTAEQWATLGDRLFSLNCSVEDLQMAIDDKEPYDKLSEMVHTLLSNARGLELR